MQKWGEVIACSDPGCLTRAEVLAAERLWENWNPQPLLHLGLFTVVDVLLWMRVSGQSVMWKMSTTFRLFKSSIFLDCLGKTMLLGCLGKVIYSYQREDRLRDRVSF
jgi:hypothetical protein